MPRCKELVMCRIIGGRKSGKRRPAEKAAESLQPFAPKGFGGYRDGRAQNGAPRRRGAPRSTRKGEVPYCCPGYSPVTIRTSDSDAFAPEPPAARHSSAKPRATTRGPRRRRARCAAPRSWRQPSAPAPSRARGRCPRPWTSGAPGPSRRRRRTSPRPWGGRRPPLAHLRAGRLQHVAPEVPDERGPYGVGAAAPSAWGVLAGQRGGRVPGQCGGEHTASGSCFAYASG